MCFRVDSRFNSERVVAQPILVYKYLLKTRSPKRFVSPYQHMRYYPGRTYKPVRLRRGYTDVQNDFSCVIFQGFHSFLTGLCKDTYLVPMIIPTGAHFYVNFVDMELVSSHIRFPRTRADGLLPDLTEANLGQRSYIL